MKSKACNGGVIRLLQLQVVLLGFTSCSGATSVQAGWDRNEVEKQLGAPTSVLRSEPDWRLFLPHSPCKNLDTKLVRRYERWFRSDVLVSFNAADKVNCAWSVDVVEVTQ